MKQLHAGVSSLDGDTLWHTDDNGLYWCGHWHHRTPTQLLNECRTTIDDLLRSHPELQYVPDSSVTPLTSSEETIGALISENARIGAELKRMTERSEMLSGEHDNKIRNALLHDIVEHVKATAMRSPIAPYDYCDGGMIEYLNSLRSSP